MTTTPNASSNAPTDPNRLVEHRPWGYFEVLSAHATHKVKRLVVAPGAQLSDQRHDHRREHWAIVEGTGQVTLSDRVHPLSMGDSVMIAEREWHRLANTGTAPLVVIETQLGSILTEDDIERRADDFGRR